MNVYQAIMIQKDSIETSCREIESIVGPRANTVRGMILATDMARNVIMDTVTVGDVCETR